MSERFSLYYTYDCTTAKDLTVAQKKELVSCIEELSEEQLKMVVMLIDEHRACEINTEGVKPSEAVEKSDSTIPDPFGPGGVAHRATPYGGRQETDGVHFDISDLPIPLRHILLRFSKSQKMK